MNKEMGQNCCENKTSELSALRKRQGRVLKIVLAINAIMFAAEFISGLLSRSSALTADSLDMLGDAIVYGFSLYVLHRNGTWKAKAALLKGLIIVGFAAFVLADTTRKALVDSVPAPETMGIIGALALLANATCLFLLWRHKSDDLNMRSTFICSRNDIISNTGVLLAAIGVSLMSSKWPDIVVGYIIAVVFFLSAWSILVEAIRQISASTGFQNTDG